MKEEQQKEIVSDNVESKIVCKKCRGNTDRDSKIWKIYPWIQFTSHLTCTHI